MPLQNIILHNHTIMTDIPQKPITISDSQGLWYNIRHDHSKCTVVVKDEFTGNKQAHGYMVGTENYVAYKHTYIP